MADAPAEKGKDWKFDFSGWKTMGDIEAFNLKMGTGKLADQFEAMSGIISSWEYDSDPRDIESYRKLSPGQWKKASERAGKATQNFLENAD